MRDAALCGLNPKDRDDPKALQFRYDISSSIPHVDDSFISKTLYEPIKNCLKTATDTPFESWKIISFRLEILELL